MDPLHYLLDHPPRDPDAPRNPVLTAQVMERVRAQVARQPTAISWCPLLAGAAMLLAVIPMDIDVGELVSVFNSALFVELLVVVVLFLVTLLAARRFA